VSLLVLYFRSIILVLKSDTRDDVNNYNRASSNQSRHHQTLESIRIPEQIAGLQQGRVLSWLLPTTNAWFSLSK
jgi:hypothetical protein